MDDVRASGTLMQIIHILRNHRHVEVLLQFGKSDVPRIRLYIEQLLAAFIIEVNNQLRVAYISLGTGNLHHRIFVPQSARITKRTDTTLGTHSGTGQNDQVLHTKSPFYSIITVSFLQKYGRLPKLPQI